MIYHNRVHFLFTLYVSSMLLCSMYLLYYEIQAGRVGSNNDMHSHGSTVQQHKELLLRYFTITSIHILLIKTSQMATINIGGMWKYHHPILRSLHCKLYRNRWRYKILLQEGSGHLGTRTNLTQLFLRNNLEEKICIIFMHL